MKDPLYRLPSELRLDILSNLSSLLDLRCAICASPALLGAFKTDYARRIFDCVLVRDETGAELLQRVITVVGAARSPSLYTLSEVKAGVLGLGTNLERDDFDNRLSYSVLLGLLETHTFLNRVTNIVLGLLLDRLNSLEFRKGDPPEETTEFGEYIHSVRYEPELNKFPSWVEYHRVLRALWRIQVFCDLYRHPCGNFMCAKSLYHLWQSLIKIEHHEWEEMACVVICLKDYSISHNCKLEDVFNGQVKIDMDRHSKHPTMPANDATQKCWKQIPDYARCAPAYHFYLCDLGRCSGFFAQCSSRQLTAVGFVIWDLERMGK